MSGIHVVRQSKLRHVYGQVEKKEFCYDDIRVTKNSWDSMFCAVNPKFLAVVTEAAGGGSFIVLPLAKVGRQDKDTPVVAGHKGPVLDIQWCPFNDNVIASASDDCTVKVWQIPDGGLFISMTEPIVSLEYHQRRVGYVQWHPTANNILMSIDFRRPARVRAVVEPDEYASSRNILFCADQYSGSDCKIVIWNIGTGEALKVVDCHPDVIFSAAFNYNGSKLVTTCKDKMIRVIDARTGEVLEKGKGHDGAKAMRAIYLKDGSIFTTGFSKMSERQYALRDETMLEDAISTIEVDSSNGIFIPLYDPDTNLLFVTAKGDSQIRYFEVNMDQPPYVHYVNTFLSSDPHRGLGVMPKRGCDILSNEIYRLYKLHGNGKVEPIKFVVPRKSDTFQEDLYPDTAGDTPALSADEWWNQKKDANPVMISLRGGYQAKSSQTLKVDKKSNILDKMPSKGQGGGANGNFEDGQITPPSEPVTSVSAAQYEELQAELKSLRKIVMAQEKRIKILEGGKPDEDGEVGDKKATANGAH